MLPLDDSWLRDSGPIVVLGPEGRRPGIDFRFNAWGEAFTPTTATPRSPTAARAPRDRALRAFADGAGGRRDRGRRRRAARDHRAVPARPEPQPAARPRGHRGGAARCARRRAGRVARRGLVEDADTDGHVDNVCAFLAPGRVLLQTVGRREDPNHGLGAGERAAAGAARDRGRALGAAAAHEARGRQRRRDPLHELLPVNGAAIVPLGEQDADMDAEALRRLGALLPGREIVGVPGRCSRSAAGACTASPSRSPQARVIAAWRRPRSLACDCRPRSLRPGQATPLRA